jgi:hypothetical protein
VDYDHVLAPLPAGGTRVRFLVDGEGFGVSLLGPLFAKVYARNLDRDPAAPGRARRPGEQPLTAR